jgi:hypothetical protein
VPALPGDAGLPVLGLETGQDAGVWGALSEDERRALKRRNARARARLAGSPFPRRQVSSSAAAS